MNMDAINDALDIGTTQALTPTLSRLSKIFDCKSASYIGLSIPDGRGAKTAFGYSTYGLKWINKYAENNYRLIDPVVKNGIRRLLPLDWLEVRYQNKRSTEFFLEAEAHGVAANGLSFPIRGRFSELALFSINTDVSQRDWVAFKKQHAADLQMAAYIYHEKVLELMGVNSNTSNLSKRETEIVTWLAIGKTQWEISIILDISQSTVRYHVNNIKSKMNAMTVAQAIANAIANNAIQL